MEEASEESEASGEAEKSKEAKESEEHSSEEGKRSKEQSSACAVVQRKLPPVLTAAKKDYSRWDSSPRRRPP